jgi:hypothetical protein
MHTITRFALVLFATLSLGAIEAAASSETPTAADLGREPRIALVVGNANYHDEMKLQNPANDAELIAASLERVGFKVILLTDAGQKALQHAIVDFGDRLSKAGPDATGLFYYAGHGLQVGGENYLVPVDADISREADVEIDAVEADLVLKQMAFAGSRVNILVLDSCRNNPLARDFRSVAAGQGFAEIRSKPKGTFISYSTAPGEVAVDGTDGHSPFAEALAAAMQLPGLDLPEVFQHVREQVLDATDQKQTPWDSSSLVKSFYFIPPHQDAQHNAVARIASAAAQPADLATPNHGARHAAALRAAAAETVAAAPAPVPSRVATDAAKPAEADAPVFIAAGRSLYARPGSRMRAAPSTASGIVAKLATNAALRAIARSADGDWWQVALADGRTGYVHRQAISEAPILAKLPATTRPVTVATTRPAPRRQNGVKSGIGFVDEAMSWLSNAAAAGGPAPKTVRTQH